MKAFILVIALFVTFSAQAQNDLVSAKKGKREPIPVDRDDRRGGGETPHPREETYEGNERGGGSYEDGSGSGDGEGGMIGELFYTAGVSPRAPKTSTSSEDLGEVVVHTVKIQRVVSAFEVCVETTVVVIEKASGKVVSSERSEYCNHY